MTLAINILNNIFPLHTKMQNYHLEHPMCYNKSHNIIIKLLMLMNYIMLICRSTLNIINAEAILNDKKE